VFLLSRMVEARTRGATTAEAVTTGLARTGRVISAAAILLIVVTGAFALSSVTTMRFIGVGMIVALFLDATVVRMLLVPAVLKLMGDAAWWAPGPLRRLQERAGLAEYEDEELFPTVSVGRHAAREPGTARPPVAVAGAAPPRHASWFEAPGGGAGSGHLSAGVPVPGGATSGYPVAGSAPLPAPSRITLDRPAAVGESGFLPAEGPGERTDSLEPPAWPPASGQPSGSRTSGAASGQPSGSRTSGAVPVLGSPTPDAAPDASGAGPASAPGVSTDRTGSPGTTGSAGPASGGAAFDDQSPDQPITLDLAGRVSPAAGPVSPAPDPVSPALHPVSPAPDRVSPALHPVSPAPDRVSPALHPVSPAPDRVSPALHPVSPALHPVSPAADPAAHATAPDTSPPRTTDTSRTGPTGTSRPTATGLDPDPAHRPGEHDRAPRDDDAGRDEPGTDATAVLELPPGHRRPPS
jgi:RND superfamily putative drug exporter